jgi:hypothetical protein
MVDLVMVASILRSQPSVTPTLVVDAKDAAQTDYWASRLKVTHDDFFTAIDQVGPSIAAIRRHLGK